jgi:hypothetical protein
MPFKDPEKRSADNIARGRAWRAANPDRVKAWQEANKDRKAATRKAYFQTPRGQALRNVAASHHRAHKGHATPPWQPREELDAIWMACPEGHHVDHIHPLKGKLSSGLDVSLEPPVPARLYQHLEVQQATGSRCLRLVDAYRSPGGSRRWAWGVVAGSGLRAGLMADDPNGRTKAARDLKMTTEEW